VRRLLVDTHALLWWLADDGGLSSAAREALADPASEALVSAATIWEIAIKNALGRLIVPADLPDVVAEQGFISLPVDAAHTWRVRTLPPHHRDPFDRLLIAQAQVERLTLVTADARFADYEVDICW
jgi:PIN domain nuclease of toxin-antitoxin system